ncbi:Platinum sensitivity protein, variant 2 [Basidiobolus ranarum]|uniref:Platinum sensitivity protein, variant 2 n=1 Tax=Basidiobolus ranarum TaxID=34480 RepID=A0ABR2W2X4_9FUNG
MEISSRRRVKVYELAEDNAWQDKGTGYCVCMYIEDKQELYLHVLSEEDNTLLLNSKVMKGDVYQKQQDTLIVWTETSGQDLALSFQEAEGCTEAWDIIIDMQKRLPGLQHEPNGESFRELSDSQITLPKPELSNLSEIETIIRQFGRFVYGRDNLTSYVVHEKYIDQLLPIFETCECIENERDLYTLYNIMKGLILLNENCIFEYIVQDHIILGVVGILEYDPDYPKARPKHREYLGNNLHFKQVIPIRDKGIENKIHQTFRLQYLKDVVLARTLDDNTFSILNSLIFFNNVDIVNYLQHDHEFLRELFGVLNNPEESKERKRDVVFFVQQFCSIAKNLAIIHRSGLYRSLSQHGLFSTFDYALPDPDVNVRIVGAEILCTILDLDPNLVRSYVLAQVKQNRKPLIETVVERFIADENLGVKVQYGEVLKVLLDTSPSFGDHSLASPVEALMAPKSDPESDELLTLFYERHMSKLFEPILQFPDYQSMDTELVLSQSNLTLCYLLCELLCFFVRLHSFRSKYFVLSSNIFTKIVTLFKSREKHLKLGALRFFRTCIGLKDEFYNRFIVKHDLFRPIVDLFLATDGKNNLTNSACLELFEFIRKVNDILPKK